MDDICENVEEYSLNQEHKVLIIFDIVIPDMLNKKEKLQQIVAELIIEGRKLNIFLAFITQTYFALPKYIGLNSGHYFVIKFPTIASFYKLYLIIHQI